MWSELHKPEVESAHVSQLKGSIYSDGAFFNALNPHDLPMLQLFAPDLEASLQMKSWGMTVALPELKWRQAEHSPPEYSTSGA
jgi:hypothetical protein